MQLIVINENYYAFARLLPMQTKSTEITGRCVILPKKMLLVALNNFKGLRKFLRQLFVYLAYHLKFFIQFAS